MTITVKSPQDKAPERGQSCTVQLMLAEGGSAGAHELVSTSVVVEVPPNDTPTLSFAEPSRIVLVEDQTARLTITAMPAPVEDVLLHLQFDASISVQTPQP